MSEFETSFAGIKCAFVAPSQMVRLCYWTFQRRAGAAEKLHARLKTPQRGASLGGPFSHHAVGERGFIAASTWPRGALFEPQERLGPLFLGELIGAQTN